MYLEDGFFAGGRGEKPRKEFIAASKGYPATRDPAAESPKGVLNSDLDAAALRSMRQKYGPRAPN